MKILCSLLAVIFSVLACKTLGKAEGRKARDKSITAESPSGSTDMANLVLGLNDTSFKIYGNMVQSPKASTQNLFISPMSVSLALGMTYLGARAGTEAEMAKALSIPGKSDAIGPAYASLLQRLKGTKSADGYELAIANSVWAQQDFGFTKDYLSQVKTHFASEVRLKNFKDGEARSKAIDEINQWALDNTNQKIDGIVDSASVGEDTRAILANAVYFLGDWVHPFPAQETAQKTPMTFSRLDKTEVKVEQMSDKWSVRYAEVEGAKLIELPYKSKEDPAASKFSMVLVLPEKKTSLIDFEKGLTADKWNKMLEAMLPVKVIVNLPKWELHSDLMKLKEPLKQLGMVAAFDDGGGADFSGMTGKRDLYINEVLHKTFIRVDELGTEAAAVTAVSMFEVSSAAIVEPKTFIADRPFVYAIREINSGAILFIGRVVDPSLKK
jgi:serpin B